MVPALRQVGKREDSEFNRLLQSKEKLMGVRVSARTGTHTPAQTRTHPQLVLTEHVSDAEPPHTPQALRMRWAHRSTNVLSWVVSTTLKPADYVFGYQPYVLVRKAEAPNFPPSFVGGGPDRVRARARGEEAAPCAHGRHCAQAAFVYLLAASGFSFTTAPTPYLLQHPSAWRYTQSAFQHFDALASWSCWRRFADAAAWWWSFRPSEPCHLSQTVWPHVHKSHGLVCVADDVHEE